MHTLYLLYNHRAVRCVGWAVNAPLPRSVLYTQAQTLKVQHVQNSWMLEIDIPPPGFQKALPDLR